MRKPLIAVLAVLTSLAVAAVAIAQQSANLSTTVSPKKAGTKKKPANTRLSFKVANNNPDATLTRLEILLPRTLKVSGKGFPACSDQKIIDDDCKRKSLVGTGTASAVLGVNNDPGEPRSPLTFKIRAFAGGAKSINFRLASNEIETLVVVAPGKLTKSGRKLTVRVPESAQSPDGVTFAGLQDIVAVLGAKNKKRKLISANGCTKGQHNINTKLFFRDNGADPGGTTAASDSAACRK